MPLDRRTLLRGVAGSVALAGLGRLGQHAPPAATPAAGPRAGVERLGGLSAAARDAEGVVAEAVRARHPFGLVTACAPPGAAVELRVSADGRTFGPWRGVDLDHGRHEGPDAPEAARARRRRPTAEGRVPGAPLWVGSAAYVQVRVVDGADVADVEVLTVPRRGGGGPQPASAVPAAVVPAAGAPGEPDLLTPVVGGLSIVTRDEWGADESLRKGSPSYAERCLHGIVHHTATGNEYRPDEAPAIVRSIYEFHTQGRGWNDIGYNLLIDRYGVIYEGRYGGLDLPVVGAHAAGSNTGSFGVAVIGDFRTDELPWEAREALFEVLAAKFDLHAIDPDAEVTTADGEHEVPTLAGHRDVGSTSCPGGEIHDHLPTWREGLRRRVTLVPTDIDGHVHERNILSVREAGIAGGYPDGTYRPDRTVTRGQMATFLTRAGQLPPGEDASFADVPSRHAHRRGILAAADAGVAEGHSDGTFRPADAVTRGQMATFLARALDLDPRPQGSTFTDVPPDHVHHGAIEAVAEAGIAEGYSDGTFRPAQPVTRGQMASFLARGFELPAPSRGPRDPEDLEDPEDVEDDGDADGPEAAGGGRRLTPGAMRA